MRTLLPVSLLALAACKGGGDDGTAAAVEPCASGDECTYDQPGAIFTYAGVPGEAMFSAEGEHRLNASLYLPQDIAFGSDGIPAFPDFNNHRIRQIGADEMVYTISGTGMLGDGPIGTSGCYAPEPCSAEAAAWNNPTNVEVDPNDPNIVWVAAWHNSRINRIDITTGELEWFAGTGGRQYGGDGGPATEAVLDLPSSVAFDERNGDMYISDQANHVIRRIPAGSDTIELVAGVPREPGFGGDGGQALDAKLHGHTAQKADPGSKITIHDGTLYLADTVNGVIRTIDLDSGVIERFAGAYTSLGSDDAGVDLGSVPGYSGDGGDALDAVFNTPRDVAVGIDGEVYIADTKNSCVRVVDPDTNIVTTFAGQCGTIGYDGDGGFAGDSLLGTPFGVSVDGDGNVYIADTLNHVIRRVAR